MGVKIQTLRDQIEEIRATDRLTCSTLMSSSSVSRPAPAARPSFSSAVSGNPVAALTIQARGRFPPADSASTTAPSVLPSPLSRLITPTGAVAQDFWNDELTTAERLAALDSDDTAEI